MTAHQQEQTELGEMGFGDLVAETLDGPGIWLKVAPRGKTKLVLLDNLPFRYRGHWMRGRYVPCPGARDCGHCSIGIGSKVRYVFAMYNADQMRPGLLEVGPDTAGLIRQEQVKAGEAPGICLLFEKAGGVINGSIKVTTFHTLYSKRDLPPAPDIQRIMRQQWAMPENER